MALVVEGLCYRYGDFDVLRDVSFRVEEGWFCCVVGPSGCGKTTLLRVLAGLAEPSSGSVALNGHKPDCREGKTGFVFQEDALFPWRTVQANVEFGLEIAGLARAERQEIARRHLELVGLWEYRHYYPWQLSGGMKQKLAVARVLAPEPRLVLMDEPFVSLDALTRNRMQAELLNIWARSKVTVVFVTHSIDEAVFLADNVVVLSSRPATVRCVVAVDIPRPRSRTSPEFNAIRGEILELLEGKDPA